jgi:hypothetical protein
VTKRLHGARSRRAAKAVCVGSLVVLVASLAPVLPEASAGGLPLASQGEPDPKEPKSGRGVRELWELYPIDPASPGTPLPTPDARLEERDPGEGPAEREGESSDGGQGSPSGRDAPWVPAGMLLAVGAAGGAAALLWRRSRREPRPGSSGHVPHRLPRAGATPERPPLRASGRRNGAGDREHVRVHLRDGRRIDGWRKDDGLSEDSRVIVLDVESVHDSAGMELASTPLDSFVLPLQIDRIEKLD